MRFPGPFRLPWPALLAAACASHPSSVTRLADGIPYQSRYVPPEAYAAYARASLLEADGQLRAALRGYRRALRLDPGAPGIQTRIGTVSCRLSTRAGDDWAKAAEQAFQEALESDPELSIAWLERARCRDRLGDLDVALRSALKGASIDPASLEGALLVADLADRAGRPDLSQAFLEELVARFPESRTAWRSLLDHARRSRHAAELHRARRALFALGEAQVSREPELYERLRAGDLEGARRQAVAAGLGPGRLAVRALEAGALELSRAQAALVLAADPDDSDAWIAALVLADLEGDAERFRTTALAAPERPTPPSPEALQALDRLLRRRLGEAARVSPPELRGQVR